MEEYYSSKLISSTIVVREDEDDQTTVFIGFPESVFGTEIQVTLRMT